MSLLLRNWIWLTIIVISATLGALLITFIQQDTLRVNITNYPNQDIITTIAFGRPMTDSGDLLGTPWVFAERQGSNMIIGKPPENLFVPSSSMIVFTETSDEEGFCVLRSSNGNARVTLVGVGSKDGVGWFPSSVTLSHNLRQRFAAFELDGDVIVPVFATSPVDVTTGICPVQVNIMLKRGWNWLMVGSENDTVTLTRIDAPRGVRLLLPTSADDFLGGQRSD
jgi:hypothetical protein